MDRKNMVGITTPLAWLAFLFLFWLSMTGSFQIPELLAGLAAALLCALLVRASDISNLLEFRLKRGWLRPIYQLPKKVGRDCWLLSLHLLKSIRRPPASGGKFRAVSFQNGGKGPYDVTRRAFITAVISFSPNSYVIGIDEEDNLLLLHEFLHTGDEEPV